MALIAKFIRTDRKIAFKSSVECGWTYGTVAGRRVLHLETYGSAQRQVAGKGSQFLRLDLDAAKNLKAILMEAFPELAGE